MKPNWKWALVLFAWLAPIFWLWALFLFPNAWQDHEGYHQLVWLIAISGAHFLVGALLCVFAGLGVLRFRLALSVMLAPLAHEGRAEAFSCHAHSIAEARPKADSPNGTFPFDIYVPMRHIGPHETFRLHGIAGAQG